MTWVNAAIAVYGLYESNRQRRAGNRKQKKQEAAWEQSMEEQRKRQAMLDKLGQPLFGQGQENLNILQSYLRQAASGDRALTMQAVAPQINALADMNRGSMTARGNLGGRGAGIPDDQNQQYQGQVNNLLFGARQDALGQLGNLGSLQSRLALEAMGQSAGLSNNMLQLGLQARDLMFNQGYLSGQGHMAWLDQLGKTWGDIYAAWQKRQKPQATPSGASTAPSGNLLSGWGSGSNLGFGRSSPTPSTATGGPLAQWGISSHYTPAGNIYGGKSSS